MGSKRLRDPLWPNCVGMGIFIRSNNDNEVNFWLSKKVAQIEIFGGLRGFVGIFRYYSRIHCFRQKVNRRCEKEIKGQVK